MSDAAPAGPDGRRLRVLVVTQLFPNEAEPMLAPYNRHQCLALSRIAQVDVRAVIPWFPGASLFGRWSTAGRQAGIPAEEDVQGLRVRHPRVLFVPKVGAAWSPALYEASLWPRLRRLRGQVDVVLGCWAYPDGVAAVRLARRLGAASVVKVHGSDLNVVAGLEPMRTVMARTLPTAGGLVAVSRPLAEKAVELGVPRERVHLVRNGLDRAHFRVRDRRAVRQELGIPAGARLVLFVGLVDRTKGLGELLAAFEALAKADPELQLAIVGDGPGVPLARAVAERHPGRVWLTGALPSAEVARWMGACDVVTLPSWNEGTPNVLLEALASGRRVVATRVGGIPDVVTAPAMGELVPVNAPSELAEALRRVAREPYSPEALAAAGPPSWDESAAHLLAVLEGAVRARAASPGRAAGGLTA